MGLNDHDEIFSNEPSPLEIQPNGPLQMNFQQFTNQSLKDSELKLKD